MFPTARVGSREREKTEKSAGASADESPTSVCLIGIGIEIIDIFIIFR